MAADRSTELIADGLQRIADALEQYVKLEQQRFEKQYPIRPTTPVTVSKAKYTSDEEKPEEKGEIFPESEQEDGVQVYGRREQRIREQQARSPRPKARSGS